MVRVLAGLALSLWETVHVYVCTLVLIGGVGKCTCKKHEMGTMLGAGSGCGSGPREHVPPKSAYCIANALSTVCPVSDQVHIT